MPDYRIERWREVFLPNMATLRYKLTAEGFNLSQWTDQPGAAYGWRKFPFERAHWIISGSLRLTIRNVGTFTLDTGDRIYIPVENYYRWEAAGEQPILYIIGEKDAPVEKKKRGRKKKEKNL